MINTHILIKNSYTDFCFLSLSIDKVARGIPINFTRLE